MVPIDVKIVMERVNGLNNVLKNKNNFFILVIV